MKLGKFIQGLDVLRNFYDNPNGYHLGAEHDQIYVYATDSPLPAESVKFLVELGWFQPGVNIGEDDDFKAEHYVPDEGWSVYV
jgi:hypothetical protein